MRVEVHGEAFKSKYDESYNLGENIHQFSARVGLKVGSCIARISKIKSELRNRGLTKEQIETIFPKLQRVSGSGRKSRNEDFINKLVAKVQDIV